MTVQELTRHAPISAPAAASLDPRARFRRRSAISDLLVILAWTSGAVAAALYLASGGLNDVHDVGAFLTALGIVAGLIGTDFILLMLVLAARVPVIDRAIGHDRAIAVHRQLGKPALYLILGHGALLLIGYGMADGLDPIAEIGPMLALPDMITALIGTALLIAVVVTSLVAVRRKFPYEFWHVIHLLSYAAVLFALPHQLSIGGTLADGAAQRVYWIALYVVALGAIVVFRFGLPTIRSIRHGVRVERVDWIARDVASIQLVGSDLRALGAGGGQFLIWRFWTAGTWWHAHPISLSAVPTARHARITVRVLGPGTRRFAAVKPGTRVSFEGPYGIFTDAARTAPRLAIVAAGIGITPARALLEGSSLRPGEATILVRSSSDNQAFLWDELTDLAEARGATLFAMVGPRAGDSWMSERDASRGVTLRSVFPDLQNSDLYVCGPQAWADAVVADARELGLPEHQIHNESFEL
ncbi:MAG TPA: ferredoxin reductase family protein [Pseudolysinimonas sp.]|jgi:predicted ferric reductase